MGEDEAEGYGFVVGVAWARQPDTPGDQIGRALELAAADDPWARVGGEAAAGAALLEALGSYLAGGGDGAPAEEFWADVEERTGLDVREEADDADRVLRGFLAGVRDAVARQ